MSFEDDLRNCIEMRLWLIQENKFNYEDMYKAREDYFTAGPNEVCKNKETENSVYLLLSEFVTDRDDIRNRIRSIKNEIKSQLEKEGRFNRNTLNDIKYLLTHDENTSEYIGNIIKQRYAGNDQYKIAYILLDSDLSVEENEFLKRDPIGYINDQSSENKSKAIFLSMKKAAIGNNDYNMDTVLRLKDHLLANIGNESVWSKVFKKDSPKEVTRALSLLADDLHSDTFINNPEILEIIRNYNDALNYKEIRMLIVNSLFSSSTLINNELYNYSVPDIFQATVEMANKHNPEDFLSRIKEMLINFGRFDKAGLHQLKELSRTRSYSTLVDIYGSTYPDVDSSKIGKACKTLSQRLDQSSYTSNFEGAKEEIRKFFGSHSSVHKIIEELNAMVKNLDNGTTSTEEYFFEGHLQDISACKLACYDLIQEYIDKERLKLQGG